MSSKKIIVTGICVAVGVGVVILLWFVLVPTKNHVMEQVVEESAEEDIATNESLTIGSIISYETEEIRDNCQSGYDCHIRLWGIDEKGLKALIVDDLTSLFRHTTGKDDRYSIQKFLFPEHSSTLIFEATIGSSGCCSLYAYDVSKGVFTEHGRVRSMLGGELPSPDNTKIIKFVPPGAELHVLDVLTNGVIATVKAGPGETFSKGDNGYSGDPYGAYEWIDNSSFSYEVFSSVDMPEGYSSRPLKETRTFVVH